MQVIDIAMIIENALGKSTESALCKGLMLN
jgi:hypothetical protein